MAAWPIASRSRPTGSTPRSSSARTRPPISRISTRSSCPAASARGARRARSRPPSSHGREKVPYLGICLGMQMAVIEAARHLADLGDAGSEEFDHEAGKKRFTPVVYHLKEWVQGNYKVTRSADDDKGGTMRLGAYDAVLAEGSRVAEVYGSTAIEERHRHRYEVDIKLPRGAGDAGAHVLGHVTGRAPARDRRGQGSPVVHRGAVPPGTQIENRSSLIPCSATSSALPRRTPAWCKARKTRVFRPGFRKETVHSAAWRIAPCTSSRMIPAISAASSVEKVSGRRMSISPARIASVFGSFCSGAYFQLS